MPTFSSSMVEPPLQHKRHVAPFTVPDTAEPALQSRKAALTATSEVGTMEPSLQRKKRPICTDVQSRQIPESADEYILLGDQSKFATNIKYQTKNLKRAEANANANNNKTMVDEYQQTAGKKRPDKSTGRPQRPQRPSRRRPKLATQPSPVKVTKPSVPKVVEPPPKAKVNTGAPGLKNKGMSAHNEKSNEASQLKSTVTTASKKNSVESAEKSEASKEKSNKKVAEVVLKEKPNIVDRKEELNDINMKKASAEASQKPQENLALKYQAGLSTGHPSRSRTRLSEYQKEFTWKKGIHSSPLIAAEQVVYKSIPEMMPAPKASKMPRSTEYQKQFHPWTVARSMPNGTAADEPHRQVRRSKSEEAVSRTLAAGLERVTSEGDKRLVMETTSARKPRLPQTKPRIVKSEYALNYREPAQYVYENGAWKGADPPHIQSSDHPPVPAVEVSVSSSSISSSWFVEVQELRRRADEYKKRAQGTHFGREHLAQLYAQQTALWDSVTSVSSLVSERTLRGSDADSEKKSASDGEITELKDETDIVIPKRRKAWTKVKDDGSLPSSVTSWKGLVPTEKQRSVGVSTTGDDGSLSSPQRHHLSRTTPAMGGLLLVKHKATDSGDGHITHKTADKQIQAARDEEPDSDDANAAAAEKMENGTEAADAGDEISSQTQVVPLSAPSPAFGMPTKDTHLLMDEQLSHDEPLRTEFVQSPLRKLIQTDWQDMNGRKSTTVPAETDWRKLNIDFTSHQRDDDEISLSRRSVASSSCSLASQVLEKARNRRDEFWGNQRPIAPSLG